MYSPECYQQTFVTSNYSGNEKFKFQRIYKTDKTQKIKLSVTNLAIRTETITTQAISVFVENSPGISSKAFYVNELQDSFARFCLGTIGDEMINYDSPLVYLDDLPLNQFDLVARDMEGDIVECRFSVTFKIEVI